jgi:threonine synthase
VKPDEEVLVFNTGAAQKYLEALPPQLPRLEKERLEALWEAVST